MSEAQKLLRIAIAFTLLASCTGINSNKDIATQVRNLDLNRGDIALCGAGGDTFGKVTFAMACSEKVQADFNLATALLHSFEYPEAEKVFARVMDQDPRCVMAYWGAAMSYFHPLWEQPSEKDLQKGARVIALGRSILEQEDGGREGDYLEAIATIYDEWETVDHRTRLIRFEDATREIFEAYPDDVEAATFHALALRASADPADKTFANQRKAGEILEAVAARQPNHPGIVHYIIHTYDYPELATKALDAARSYAAIAAASAHAQHMPSHIFTRLGLWDEGIQSNVKSVEAAKCYGENIGIKGHVDEELHGLDYLVYAYLQKANDDEALRQVTYVNTVTETYPEENFKVAYSVAIVPARYAVERKDWQAAARVEPGALKVQWEKFPWESSNLAFARLLGSVHTGQLGQANTELTKLQEAHTNLLERKDAYRSNLVHIQVLAGQAWIKQGEGKREEALALMRTAADKEDKTEKHPVTPGELVPARELLAEMYLEMGQYANALENFELSLERHPNRFCGLYGAAFTAEKLGQKEKANKFYTQLVAISDPNNNTREELVRARAIVAQ